LQIELVSLEHPKQKLFFNLHGIPNSVNLINRNESNNFLKHLIILESVFLKPIVLPIYKDDNSVKFLDFTKDSFDDVASKDFESFVESKTSNSPFQNANTDDIPHFIEGSNQYSTSTKNDTGLHQVDTQVILRFVKLVNKIVIKRTRKRLIGSQKGTAIREIKEKELETCFIDVVSMHEKLKVL